MLPQPLVRVRLTVLATAPAAAAEARRTDWKRIVLYWRLEKETRWQRFVELATAACVEVFIQENRVSSGSDQQGLWPER